MSDARWLDVEDDVEEASVHFRNARALHESTVTHADSLSEYRDAMALMHALQSAHTSAEHALLRILRILGEDAPSGEDRHQKMLARAAKSITENHERPAILSREVADDLDASVWEQGDPFLRHVRSRQAGADARGRLTSSGIIRPGSRSLS